MTKKNKVAAANHAANHARRMDIIAFLTQNAKSTVTEIYTKLGLDQSVASQHLAILRRSNLVIFEKIGKFRAYSTNNSSLVVLDEIELKYGKYFTPCKN